MANMGLVQAARQLESFGRGPDTQLAHIAPDEAQFIDYLQGGRRTNPHTGLPEYGLFGKILKAVVRVGAAVGGFMVGGPAGAAAGSAAATKLTGGSWKDALKAGAISGATAGLGQGLSGAGWNLTGTNTALSNALSGAGSASAGSGAVGAGSSALSAAPSAASSAAAAGLPTGATTGLSSSLSAATAPGAVGLGASPGFYSGLSSVAPTAASTASSLGAALAPIGGYGGAAAGLGALSAPLGKWAGQSIEIPPEQRINLNVEPFNRGYRAPQGDLTQFGEQPGGWQFFEEVNPKPKYLAHGGPVHYALGGGVMGPREQGQGLLGLGGVRMPGVPSQLEAPHMGDLTDRAQDRYTTPATQRDALRRAAVIGYMSAKDGGTVKGAGTGKDDQIPAMLSDGEHVVDAATISDLGDGSNDAGHKVMEDIKAEIRRRAGRRNPRKPTSKQGSTRSLVTKAMR